MKKALKRHGSPKAITTDGLRSYGAAMDELRCREKQEMGRWANNRVENSHLPFQRRKRAMLRFRQMKMLQKFAFVHANVHNHFGLERHLIDRLTYRERRSAALAEWQVLASEAPFLKDRRGRVESSSLRLTAPPLLVTKQAGSEDAVDLDEAVVLVLAFGQCQGRGDVA